MEFTLGVRLEVRITPGDVGRRVSVRTRTEPGSGARFTDTVGVLTAWKDGALTVTRRDGTPVALAESALVAAKVVPSAPARRPGTPAAGVAELTRTAARAWPARESERIGGWLCRAGGGWTNRANCAVPDGANGTDGTDDLPDSDLERIVAWYAARGLPALIHVPTGGAGGRELLAERLEGLGWRAEKPAVVKVAPLAPLADRAPDPRVELGRELTDRWLRGYPNAHRDEAAARLLLPAGPSVRFATVAAPSADAPAGDTPTGGGPEPQRNERPAAVGRCVVDGRWAGFAAIEVAPDQRRQGLARAVMAELARAALAEGASFAHLQVERDNAPAHALYARLGFTDHHHYHYRRAPLG
ncbi:MULTISPECIES: GNAT family N-acetyltransferase [unclassified Streptomyces]|uniref:GNAT family N-acetyltransferase n=1 Tax=unclassified Streptomyces TaxID=2593676 RepID=UPI000CD5ADDF|nr:MULTISPECIES: GNAT family N-acetyltransferase [unclassified Streptomyces]